MFESIKKLRTLHNYSQSYVAEFLSISRQMYIKYENGDVEPSVKVVKDLCRLYQVSYATILGEQSLNNKKTSYESKSYEFSFSSPEASYTSTKTFSALKIKAINQLKDLSEVQVVSVLAYMKLLTEEMAASLKEKKKDSSVDLVEVEKINAVYDKIPREEQLKFAKAGSKTVCEALKNDTW